MNTEYHFVVFYNSATNKFEIDYDTRQAMFWNGPVYEADTDTWRLLEDEEYKDGGVYDKASETLFRLLETANNERNDNENN